MSFVQNPHNHPLFLVYFGEDSSTLCSNIVDHVFSSQEDKEKVLVIELDASQLSLSAIIGQAMQVHFQHANKDYFMYATWTSEAGRKECFIAFNHRYHDISSAGTLLRWGKEQGAFPSCTLISGCVKRQPIACENREMRPVKVSTLRFNFKALEEEVKARGMSCNELLFLKTCAAIDKALAKSFYITCLHSMRRERGVNRASLGDYSCYASSLLVQSAVQDTELEQQVREYFASLRSGAITLREDDSSGLGNAEEGWWVFDTWLRSGVHLPLPGCVLDSQRVMASISLFVNRFVVAVEEGDDVCVFVFSDQFSL